MPKTTFTPGPWRISGFEIQTGGPARVVMGSDDFAICWCDGRGRPENTANAELIAAAPDLYEALKGLLADIQEYQRINNLGGGQNHWQIKAAAAINKADGMEASQ